VTVAVEREMNEFNGTFAAGLRGQVAIVTGGASGIGRATCVALARKGVRVAIADVSEHGVESAVGAIAAEGGEALGFRLDIAELSGHDALVSRVLERFGRLDILVASAGIIRPAGTSPTAVANLPVEDWDRVVAINLRGTFLTNKAVLAHMRASRAGQIINISSVFGQQGRAFDNAYCASKAGIIGLTEALADEVGRHGIRVYALLPDSVDTPIWDQNPIPRAVAALPPERVADFIVYLLAMPGDTMIVNPVIAPFSTRRRAGVGRREQRPTPDAGPAT
jgi:NAD(P)-dependent dehydrogenase (short-subunit alcohol dehydrogenase family)